MRNEVEEKRLLMSGEVESWLQRHVPGYGGPSRLQKFGFGQSNPTFRLSAKSGAYVLRRRAVLGFHATLEAPGLADAWHMSTSVIYVI